MISNEEELICVKIIPKNNVIFVTCLLKVMFTFLAFKTNYDLIIITFRV